MRLNNKLMRNVKHALLVATAILAILSCNSYKNLNKSQKGAVIGGAGGAAAGAVVGKIAGNTALGAIIGAAVGGTTGAIIGHKMDKQAAEIKKTVPTAKVQRVGEGIEVEFSSAVLFGFDQSDLSTQAQGTLNQLITVLNKYPDTYVEVQGHTDSIGTAQYNEQLSVKRATTVANYLIANNISSSRITTKGFGASAPKYTNSTEDGRAQNRRVEFLITANDKMKTDAAKEANTGGGQ
jgi:outer membrane protein OmpA-like peptidoglycan-associated protein